MRAVSNNNEVSMKIALIEPFMAGSHARWAREYADRSRHQVEIFALEGRHWKWRMHGGAVTLAREFLGADFRPDVLLATDMLDLTIFLALTRRQTSGIPAAIYFHENQLTYPWSPTDADIHNQRDAHYAFINYTSALTADKVLFNSNYHRLSFLAQLPKFLKSFPDAHEVASVKHIEKKSQTLSLGLDLKQFDAYRPTISCAGHHRPPLILWNHRWEYDKNPEDFFQALYRLEENGIAYELAVLGESYSTSPAIYAEARQRLRHRIIHWGFVEEFSDYAGWLWRADILPVTSIHDFFGVSVVQALYCGCRPLLPQRLAYPEHINHDDHQQCFYNDFDDLVMRLSKLCQNVDEESIDALRAHVARYDWDEMVSLYDDVLEGLTVT